MSDVRELAPTAFVQGTSAVCDAVLRLRGDALVQELSRLARTLTGSAHGRFVPGPGLVLTNARSIGQGRKTVPASKITFTCGSRSLAARILGLPRVGLAAVVPNLMELPGHAG